MTVIRVHIMRTGSFLLDGKTGTIADLRAALERAKEHKSAVWYYREDADVPATDDQMKVLKVITDAKLPVSLSTKPDFSDYVGEDGRSHPRPASSPQPQALRGYQFFQPPNTPGVGVLRLDTSDAQHWFLVSRSILQKLSAELARLADKLQPVQ